MADSFPDRTATAGPPPARQHQTGAGHGPVHTAFPVIGIGASAGGLEACTKLFDAFPVTSGMAFILVQHLHPTQESLMADLLAGHTSLTVRQAVDGTTIAENHIYVIPPGAYLSVSSGIIQLTKPQVRRGARLPFDFLLHSLAESYGEEAACLVLSGTGTDGSSGLKSIKEKGGLVVAQRPDDAGYDGMPRSAIETGLVDMVLSAAEMPTALLEHFRQRPSIGTSGQNHEEPPRDRLSEIVDLIRAQTGHDFTLYKPGTLQRRIEARMTIASLRSDDQPRYLEMLQADPAELGQLAQEFLINVTSFFRDPHAFELLSDKVLPDLTREQSTTGHLRIWVAGCSTGEEAYPLQCYFANKHP